MSRADYIRATNTAYNVISTFNIWNIPVYLDDIIKCIPRLRLITYTHYAELNQTNIQSVIEDYDEYGSLIIQRPKGYLILYNDQKSYDVIRFTIAHELGHYFLGHREHNQINDMEANCFARNLLCPLPAFDILSRDHYFFIPSIFGISPLAATTRISFIQTDRFNLDKELYECVKSTLGNSFFIDYYSRYKYLV